MLPSSLYKEITLIKIKRKLQASADRKIVLINKKL